MEVYIITPFPNSINTLIENNIANQGVKKDSLALRLLILEISPKIIIKRSMMSLMEVEVEW